MPEPVPDSTAGREWGLILVLAALTLAAAGVRHARSRARPLPGVVRAAEEADFLLDVNRASADELRVLPGIGESRAAAAVAARDENGSFASLECFAQAAGLPEHVLDDISGLVALGRAEDTSRRAPMNLGASEGGRKEER